MELPLTVEAALRSPEYYDYEFETTCRNRREWGKFRDTQLWRCINDPARFIAAYEEEEEA